MRPQELIHIGIFLALILLLRIFLVVLLEAHNVSHKYIPARYSAHVSTEVTPHWNTLVYNVPHWSNPCWNNTGQNVPDWSNPCWNKWGVVQGI